MTARLREIVIRLLGGNEIHIEEFIRARARLSIQKMLDFAAAEKAGQIQLGD